MPNLYLKLPIILILIALNLHIYWQVRNHEFIGLDDGVYVLNNYPVQKGLTKESITWAFSSFHSSNWHPLTWLSHIFDYQLYGANPKGHHLTNLLFHILNSVLLFLIFEQITSSIWKSAFLAILFALHPINVESVAWVSQRKNVLSTFFWLLTTIAYLRYAKKPDPSVSI